MDPRSNRNGARALVTSCSLGSSRRRCKARPVSSWSLVACAGSSTFPPATQEMPDHSARELPMMLLEARTGPVSLWLAAAQASDGERPANQGRSPSAHLRPLRVLIVEDEFFIALDIEASLMALGHVSVGIAVSGDEAVSVAGRERPDVVLMD